MTLQTITSPSTRRQKGVSGLSASSPMISGSSIDKPFAIHSTSLAKSPIQLAFSLPQPSPGGSKKPTDRYPKYGTEREREGLHLTVDAATSANVATKSVADGSAP